MLRYDVRFDDPASHHVDVEIRLGEVDGEVVLWMPTWTPGSYLVREFARNVRTPVAVDADGVARPLERVDKCRFRTRGDGTERTIRYRVYAFELTVRTSFVEDGNALLNGHSIFLAVAGREREPIELGVRLPAGWDVATGLEERDATSGTRRFGASHYDDLCDHPIQCGRFERLPFEVEGKPHEVVLVGAGNPDRERLVEDTRRIVETAAATFGPLPYERYLFLVQHSAAGRGGLEHENSSVLQFPRFGYSDPRLYHDFATLVAHEHFHVWNVKRTVPRDFVPYDLVGETYSRLLWVSEGFTAYYDELLTARAGVATEDRYLERLGEEISRYRETPGRLVQSLADASLLAWVGLYRPDEASPNATVSYYQKGALVALLLDLEIRRLTGGEGSLDDVMRTLFARFPAASDGFTEDDLIGIVAERAGADLAPFFETAVHGTDELDFEAALAGVGLRLERKASSPPRVRDLLGVRIRKGSRRLRIDTVETGSPAA
ncbi:MAG: M61 family metallopeptidase, partial [Planctomycetota bacterium JB042]